jgi:hypothetical protein
MFAKQRMHDLLLGGASGYQYDVLPLAATESLP